jgi:uncharacterized protein
MVSVRQFQFQVTLLPDAGMDVAGSLPVHDLDIEDTPVMQFPYDLDYRFNVSRMQEDILVKGKITFKARCECALCLEWADQKFQVSDACYFLEKVEADVVDLTEEVREDILLALPLRSICGDGCQGLCPACGGNRNRGECRCPPEGETESLGKASPWGVLDSLSLPVKKEDKPAAESVKRKIQGGVPAAAKPKKAAARPKAPVKPKKLNQD